MSHPGSRAPTRSELRWFGLLLLTVFASLAALVAWRFEAGGFARGLAGTGVALALLYYALPPLRRPLYRGWMRLVTPFGRLVSQVVLAIVYFGVLTPIGVAVRAFGRDKLERRFVADARSYWTARSREADTSRYLRQS
jgi:hypothetical protein